MKTKITKRMKGFIAVAGAIAIMAAALGGTYAWWTSTAKTQSVVQMGELRVEAQFDAIRDLPYEPGGRATASGTIQNTGSIGAVLRVDSNTDIWYQYANDALEPELNPAWYEDTAGAVGVTLRPVSSDVYGEDADGNLRFAWLYNVNDENERYLYLAPGEELAVRLQANFNGTVMGNRYMEATIRIHNEVNATQCFDDATSALFGVVYRDLAPLENIADEATGFRAAASAAFPPHILAQLEVIFHQA